MTDCLRLCMVIRDECVGQGASWERIKIIKRNPFEELFN